MGESVWVITNFRNKTLHKTLLPSPRSLPPPESKGDRRETPITRDLLLFLRFSSSFSSPFYGKALVVAGSCLVRRRKKRKHNKCRLRQSNTSSVRKRRLAFFRHCERFFFPRRFFLHNSPLPYIFRLFSVSAVNNLSASVVGGGEGEGLKK